MKVRDACAVFGVAVAAAAVVFMQSLVESNDAQAGFVAKRMLAALPVEAGSPCVRMALDWRPGGRVMQGPPMAVFAAVSRLVPTGGVAVAKSLFRQRRLAAPQVGADLVLVGDKGAYRLKAAAILDWDRPSRGWPNVLVHPDVAKTIGEEWKPFDPPSAEVLEKSFASDAGRHFDMSSALLVWAALLAAACILANTMMLSAESRRRDVAIARLLGMTRGGVVLRMAAEALALSVCGAAAGIAAGLAAARLYVACDPALFPEGFAASRGAVAAAAAAAPLIAAVATLAALRSALSARPGDAVKNAVPRKRIAGMAVSFGAGFAAFAAVETWGSSLMAPFVPSHEWPDAIVSILPCGVSAFDVGKLKNIEGVSRIAELQPLQANILPLEELPSGGRMQQASPRRGNRAAYRNLLVLASDWLPDFKFVDGSRDNALAAVESGDSCIVAEMTARAHGWKRGDFITLGCGGRGPSAGEIRLKIAGIVDLNWHMVTSRGLLRGMNGMPVHTDGPVFTSFDTLAAIDTRPQHYVPMTHLWLSFDKDFLDSKGVFEAGREVEKAIAAALGADGEANTVRLHSRDEVSDGTLAHGADLIGSMARMPFVFIAIASLGFVAMLASCAEARRREFAVARAVGATRAGMAAMLAGDAFKTAFVGIAAGLPAGALSGWLFTFATRKTMAEWGLPAVFSIPWGTVAIGAAAAFAVVFAIAVPSSLWIVRSRARR